jgi:hypothetical protein
VILFSVYKELGLHLNKCNLVDRNISFAEIMDIPEEAQGDVKKSGPIDIILQPPMNACDEVTDEGNLNINILPQRQLQS